MNKSVRTIHYEIEKYIPLDVNDGDWKYLCECGYNIETARRIAKDKSEILNCITRVVCVITEKRIVERFCP